MQNYGQISSYQISFLKVLRFVEACSEFDDYNIQSVSLLFLITTTNENMKWLDNYGKCKNSKINVLILNKWLNIFLFHAQESKLKFLRQKTVHLHLNTCWKGEVITSVVKRCLLLGILSEIKLESTFL